MAIQRKYKTLTKKTKELLEGGENSLVDFKKIPDGIKHEDLVAFANADGGELILGIQETSRKDSSQYGIAIGCDISDNSILKILNKATECIPPIKIEFFAENTNSKPILRVKIPPSENKPHCTAKGTYCIRDGSRNRALHPKELLDIFLEVESNTFSARFVESSQHISQSIIDLEDRIETSVDRIGDRLGWAEYNLDDTESLLRNLQHQTELYGQLTGDISTRIRELFKQDERNDPVYNDLIETAVDIIVKQLIENENANIELHQILKDKKRGAHIVSLFKDKDLDDVVKAFQEEKEVLTIVRSLNITANGRMQRELNEEDLRKVVFYAVAKWIKEHINYLEKAEEKG